MRIRTLLVLALVLMSSVASAAEPPTQPVLSRGEINQAVVRWVAAEADEQYCAVNVISITEQVDRTVVRVAACSRACSRAIDRANQRSLLSGVELRARLTRCASAREDFSFAPVARFKSTPKEE